MDTLFSKYACPFSLIDELISSRDFYDWVIEFVNSENDRQALEVWLHKVIDQSFEEFKNSITQKEMPVDEKQVETTISNSKSILINFIPT